MNICEYYNDISKLPGEKLNTKPAIEYITPTPGMDPCTGIACKITRFPKI